MIAVSASASPEIRPASAQGSFFALGNKSLLAGLLLIVITIALYYPVGHYPFSNVDDGKYVVDNFHIKYGVDWTAVKWAFSSYYLGNWHPLTWLSHGLDCQFFYLNSGKHHEINVLFHAANALLLFWVLSQATGALGRSWMVAALFAVHPLNVESVVWISERKNVLSLFFFLLALGAYTWYARRPRADRYLLVMLLYACGLMAKAQIITFPCILLLWDYWPLQRMFAQSASPSEEAAPPRSFSWLVLEKLPLLAISAANAFLTVQAQRVAGAMSGPFNTFPFPSRVTNAIVSYPRYLGKAVWPSHLAFMYPHPGNSLPAWQVVAAVVFLLAVTVLVLLCRKRRYLPVGWFWFLGSLLPMIGLVQVGPQAMADRYAYLPLIGVLIMVCWLIADWAEPRAVFAKLLPATSLAVLVALAVVTYRQIGFWKDDVTLWSHAVNVTRGNYLAEIRLGSALLSRSQPEAAIGHFRSAQQIEPSFPATYLFIGYYEQQRGNLQTAIEWYEKLLDLTKDSIANNAQLRDDAFVDMGNAYKDLGNTPKAYECFAAAEAQRRQFARNPRN